MAAVQEQDPPKEIPTEMLGIGVPPSNIGRRIDDTDCSILIRGFEQSTCQNKKAIGDVCD